LRAALSRTGSFRWRVGVATAAATRLIRNAPRLRSSLTGVAHVPAAAIRVMRRPLPGGTSPSSRAASGTTARFGHRRRADPPSSGLASRPVRPPAISAWRARVSL
jgi:hypothetical protein